MTVAATSLKLPKTLKTRIARLARQAGESPHALMVRMLQERVEDAERFQRFVEEARAADREMQQTGEGHPATDVHEYLQARIDGRRPARTKPVRWRA